MSDDIRAMTSELARDPASLVFIRLADTLRERGQLETAKKVVRAGLERYPDSSEAHDKKANRKPADAHAHRLPACSHPDP